MPRLAVASGMLDLVSRRCAVRVVERSGDRFVHGVIADHFQQRPALGSRRAEIEQPAGGLVGQHDPLPGIHRDHAFDHSAQHGRLPIARSG